MAMRSPLRHAERLHCRLGEIVDENGGRSWLPEAFDDFARFVNECAVRRHARAPVIVDDRVAGAQRPDDDGIMPVLGDKAQIVGEGRGDPQIEPARGGIAAHKIRLHVNIAVAQQHKVDALPGDFQLV